MARTTSSPVDRNTFTTADSASDYGSDFDETALDDLLSEGRLHSRSTPLPKPQSIEEPVLPHEPPLRPRTLRISKLRQPINKKSVVEDGEGFEAVVHKGPLREGSVEVEYDESNRVAFTPTRSNGDEVRLFETPVSLEPETNDFRSPLERFRTAPKKPLSVTDIVSPAWCEMQYWYSLTKYGRVRKTSAMKEGTRVHKALEEQVHTEVPIETVTREDAFGLRIWNVIQGLRTLKATGMTREFEVWGTFEGQVINGIIDEVNTQCPDPQMEAQMAQRSQEQKGSGKTRKSKSMETDAAQKSLTDYLTSSQDGRVLEKDNTAWLGSLHEKTKTFYLIDVKTRRSPTLPSAGGRLRPTAMQLMLYHRLFTNLASNAVQAETIFKRYNLDDSAIFSDTFIAQIGNLESNFSPPASQGDGRADLESRQDSVTEIIEHNTLTKLWSLLMEEFQQTVTDPTAPTSQLLTAEFRLANSGSLIGKRSFAFDEKTFDSYVMDEMRWWRGERETKGVDIEEAFKCRICEFAEVCTWRAEKVEKAIEDSREKADLRKNRKRSDV